MNYSIKPLPKSLLEISLTLSPEEVENFVSQAVEELSKDVKTEGFRPGKIPYEVLKTRIGEMKIYEHAAERAIWKCYGEILEKEKMQPIGAPRFSIQKIVPKNPVEVKIIISLFPKVLKLADLKKIKIQSKKTDISDEKVNQALGELQKMQTIETVVNREAKKEDKVLIDLDMSLDGVPLEDGQVKNHSIYLNESYYIQGLNEKLVGMKKGDAKEFKLSFPQEHYQKNIAGKEVNFKVKANDVYELSSSPLDDEFAKKLGQKNLDELKKLLKQNLMAGAETKEKERQELVILDQMIHESQFEEIPDILINREIERMVAELTYEIERQGLNFNDYLNSIQKSVNQLKLDFASKSLERVKAGLLIHEVAKQEKIEVSDEEVMKEVEKELNVYKDDVETQKEIKRPEYAEYVRNVLRNRRVMEFLRNRCIK